MKEYILEHIFDFTNSLLLFTGIVLAVWTVFRQIRPLRIQYFYEKMIQMESDINDNNKDIWGINENNEIELENGDTQKIDLKKLSYMVTFLDAFLVSRSLRLKWSRTKKYTEYHLVSKMFKSKIYRDYWNFLVTRDLLELRNIALVADLIISCALLRKESRGLYYNLDYDFKDDEFWCRDSVVWA